MMRRLQVAIATAAVIPAGIASIALSGAGAGFTAGETRAIEDAAFSAITARQQIGGVAATSLQPADNAHEMVAPGNYKRSAHADLRQINASRFDSSQEASEGRLRQFFTGDELDRDLMYNAAQRERYSGLMKPDGAPGSPATDPSVTADYVLTGGAENFHVTDVVPDATGAVITGTTTIWINEIMVEKEDTLAANAKNIVSFRMHLIQQSDGWRVDHYEDEFLPGGGP